MRSKLYAVKLICPRATATPRPNPQRKRHPRIVKRARIRLPAHEGIPDAEIITRVEGSESTVLNIRRRFQTEPSDDLLFEKTHPGRPPKFE